MKFLFLILGSCVFIHSSFCLNHAERVAEAIQPWPENPWYFQYKGEPVLLLGGTDEDNLFNHPEMRASNFETMEAVGANYIRSTMSSRDEGNVWAFGRDERTGLYDLDIWNEEYWQRLRTTLNEAYDRNIIVQIELWATFDFYRDFWLQNPFNPENNVNYTAEESGLPAEWDYHPVQNRNYFFRQSTELNLLDHSWRTQGAFYQYQQKFWQRVMDETLGFPNVLYSIDNETKAPVEWAYLWGSKIRGEAMRRQVPVQVTEMWDSWDLRDEMHMRNFVLPPHLDAVWNGRLFTFQEVSQNNWQEGDTHYERLLWMRNTLMEHGGARPMTNVKVYHRRGGGKPDEPAIGVMRWWRNLFAGCASTRFHRPTGGPGLSPASQMNIRAARTFLNAFPVFESQPMPEALNERGQNEAFCLAVPGSAYAVYFPTGGDVELTLDAKVVTVSWFSIVNAAFQNTIPTIVDRGTIRLKTPDDGAWLVKVER